MVVVLCHVEQALLFVVPDASLFPAVVAVVVQYHVARALWFAVVALFHVALVLLFGAPDA